MPAEVPDYDLYRELRGARSASTETVEAAWRSLARRNHPDSALDPAAAAIRMTRINVARDWLVDPDLRARYDASRESRPPATAYEPAHGSSTPRSGQRYETPRGRDDLDWTLPSSKKSDAASSRGHHDPAESSIAGLTGGVEDPWAGSYAVAGGRDSRLASYLARRSGSTSQFAPR